MIQTLSETEREILAQYAYLTFCQNQQLDIHVNRSRSLLACIRGLPKIEGSLLVSRSKYLEHVIPKVREWANYYFFGLDGDRYYINQEIMDRFTEITKKTFPNLTFTKRFCLVDEETDIELIPFEYSFGYKLTENDYAETALRVKTFTAQLSKKTS